MVVCVQLHLMDARSNPGLIENVCAALGNMAETQAVRPSLMAADAITGIVHALRRSPDTMSVQYDGVVALRFLAEDWDLCPGTQFVAPLVGCGGLRVLGDTLKAYQGDELVLEATRRVFRRIGLHCAGDTALRAAVAQQAGVLGVMASLGKSVRKEFLGDLL